jgi:hypothetical protein
LVSSSIATISRSLSSRFPIAIPLCAPVGASCCAVVAQ